MSYRYENDQSGCTISTIFWTFKTEMKNRKLAFGYADYFSCITLRSTYFRIFLVLDVIHLSPKYHLLPLE